MTTKNIFITLVQVALYNYKEGSNTLEQDARNIVSCWNDLSPEDKTLLKPIAEIFMDLEIPISHINVGIESALKDADNKIRLLI